MQTHAGISLHVLACTGIRRHTIAYADARAALARRRPKALGWEDLLPLGIKTAKRIDYEHINSWRVWMISGKLNVMTRPPIDQCFNVCLRN